MTTFDATDEEVIAAYQETGSVWKTAERFGVAGQTVHKRLAALGETNGIRVFTEAEKDRLRNEYVVYRDLGRLGDLALDMGRTVPFLSRQAGKLGLTDASYERKFGRWRGLSEDAAHVMWDAFKASSATLAQFCAKHGYDDEGFRRTMHLYFADEWEHVIEAKTPLGTKYRTGRQFEYRTRDWLKDLGFFVLRSPASRSPIDLVAIRRGQVMFIQCKRGGALPPGEWNELFDLAGSVGADPVLAAAPTGFGVEFWLLLERKDGSKRRQPMVPIKELSRGRRRQVGSRLDDLTEGDEP